MTKDDNNMTNLFSKTRLWRVEPHETIETIDEKLEDAIRAEEFPVRIDGNVAKYDQSINDI